MDKKVDSGSPMVKLALAKAEALWELITKAGFTTGFGLKVRDRDKFDSLSQQEKVDVAKIASVFLRASAEIDNQYQEDIEKWKAQQEEAQKLEKEIEEDTIGEKTSEDAPISAI